MKAPKRPPEKKPVDRPAERLTVDRQQFHWDSALGRFLAEVSDLGFAPGSWPVAFRVETRIGPVVFKRGVAKFSNGGQSFADGQELISYDYLTDDGYRMVVYND